MRLRACDLAYICAGCEKKQDVDTSGLSPALPTMILHRSKEVSAYG